MLILPLHRPLSRATFPFVTALLMLVNSTVFLLFQSGDGAAIQAAQRHYVESGLGALETPAYEVWLERRGQAERLAGLRGTPEASRVLWVAQQSLTDVAFAQALDGGELFENGVDYERWRALRPRYDELRDEVFTLRHILRSSQIDPWRMLASAFLHGGFGHLLGNMIFLGALGLLVEGALGPWCFAALYLLGAMGSSAVSLWWRWGEAGGGLGASGAIAALMGAFCLVYGRQPVRFFYWVGVVFDYVRAPAIWLFPVWLGWELYNLAAHDELQIGFDAHAGGLVTGALLGALLAATKQVREEFIVADADAAADDRWERAQAYLGRLQSHEADHLLQQLQAEQPARFDVAWARQRVALNSDNRHLRRERTLELLRLRAPDGHAAVLQAEAMRACGAGAADPSAKGAAAAPCASADRSTSSCASATGGTACSSDEIAAVVGQLDGEHRLALVRRWLELDQAQAAEALLVASPADDASARGWFQLVLQRDRRHDATGLQRALHALLQRFPQHALAAKARFLLENR